MPADQASKGLAIGIVDFLKTSISNGTISAEDADSVEVAIECLTDVFQVNLEEKDAIYGKNNLLSIFNAFLKLQERRKAAGSDASAASSASDAASTSPSTSSSVSDEDKAKAETLKSEGNDALRAKDYAKAIDLYSQAIKLDPKNVIYYSNRAAAYSTSNQHKKAVEDAKTAIAIDPKYSKGYSRLGLALLSLGDSQGAMEAYQKGLDAEGSAPSDIMKKGYEAAKHKALADLDSIVPVESEKTSDSSSSARSASGAGTGANPFAGLGGLGGGPGGLDFASLMNNPEIQKMAQNLMSDPSALSSLMNNPQLKKMAENFGGAGGSGAGAGGMPNMSDMMNDPELQKMAQQFMGKK